MLTIFTVRTTIDYTFLKDYYHKTIAETYTPAEKKGILSRFLVFHKEAGVSVEHKVQALQVLILPLLNSIFQRGENKDVIDQRVRYHDFDDLQRAQINYFNILFRDLH